MRIAYVCADPGVPVFGRKGCSIHVQEVLCGLLRRGVEVDLFATRFGGPAPGALLPVRIHDLSSVFAAGAAGRERARHSANRDVRLALGRSGPFDAVYERYSLGSCAGMEFARDAGIPGILEVNAPLIDEQEEHRALIDRRSAEEAQQRCFAAASALVAVSDELAGWLESDPAARGRVHVVANGVDAEIFRPDRPPSLPAATGVFTVGFVGSLKPWHGLPVLVDAFTRLHSEDRRTRLLIVGDGSERAALDADIRARGLGAAVVRTGAVPPHEVPGLVTSMDAAVAPYPSRSPFYFSPLKVYEYMAAGRAVVASRIGQLEALLEGGECGVLCPPGDPAALADALERLRGDPALRRRLGEKAREKVLREATWDAVVSRILAVEGAAAPRNAERALAGGVQ
jgi:glycosyltransferase involved in cell wall biosynthesis